MNNQNADDLASLQYGSIWMGSYIDNNEPAVYDLPKATNFNSAVVGTSGSGKTHTIKEIIARGYIPHNVTICILDVHDDYLSIPGMPDDAFNHINLSYLHNDGTINPFKINPDNGTYMPRRNFLAIAKMFHRSMGARQLAVLSRAINCCYVEKGIIQKDKNTWSNPPPLLTDLLDFVRERKDEAALRLTKEFSALVRKEIKGEMLSKTQYASLGEEVCDMFRMLQEGNVKIWDLKQLESIEMVISSMVDTGLFGEDNITLQNGKINRISLKSLHESDQLVLIHLMLDRIFSTTLQRTEKKYRPTPNLIIVLDEGKLVKAVSKSALSPLNRIVTEGRGFGLGVLLGVQSIEHMTTDMQDNSGLFLLLNVPATGYPSVQRRLQVTKEILQDLKPRSDALAYINSGLFQPVRLFQE